MSKIIKIRNEEEKDYERVEEITRKAKWAEEFEQLYKLAVMFSRNGEAEVSPKALIFCLNFCKSQRAMIGTIFSWKVFR